jgi:hypothetical protein
MEKQLSTLLAINEAARSPEQTQAIERLKVQLEGLKATADPLADKFNTIFSDAAGNAFGDFISGTKSAKDAFKDFANSVISEIGRMIAKDFAKSLFGGGSGGSGGGIGGLLAGLFSSGGSGGFAMAGANTVGAAGGDSLGALITLKGWADGGYTGMGAANDPAGIVHKGEYVLDAQATKRLGVSYLDGVNNGGSMGGGAFTQVVNIQGRPTNETTAQIANQARRVTQKSARLA